MCLFKLVNSKYIKHIIAMQDYKRFSKQTSKAMGHSSTNVNLTYLRGLEIPELTEDDMPVV